MFIISILIFINSCFKISINKFTVNSEIKQFDYELKIGIYFMKKIRIIEETINKDKIKKLKEQNEKIQNLKTNFEQIYKKLQTKNNLKFMEVLKIILKNLKFETLKYKMNLELGTEDPILTSNIITIISTIISFFLATTSKKSKKSRNYYYRINPIYGKGMHLKLTLNCIISLKLVHIISIIYKIHKKERSDKYVRTSNRRSYDYCNE